MTVREAAQVYGTKVYRTSIGENILSIVDRLYGDRSSVFFDVITVLNNRLDWDLLPAGAEILYLSKTACYEIYEVSN